MRQLPLFFLRLVIGLVVAGLWVFGSARTWGQSGEHHRSKAVFAEALFEEPRVVGDVDVADAALADEVRWYDGL